MAKEIYPCLLLFNDLHVGKENIPEFVANWNEALCICERLGITEIALGGDLFLSRAAQTLDILLGRSRCFAGNRQERHPGYHRQRKP